MEREVVERLLASAADRMATEQEFAAAQHMGVTGVPGFILDGKYAVMGAQPAESLASAIRQVYAERATEGGNGDGAPAGAA
jgi:predicted DsbA family dithiol-disulfide isomerase